MTVNNILFDTFSNMLLACLLEPLRVVRDDLGGSVHWTIMTHGDSPLNSSSGLQITPDIPVSDAKRCDLLVLVGGDTFKTDARDPQLRYTLRSSQRADKIIAADTAAWLLAAAGYLDDCKATLHWQLIPDFAEAFPMVEVMAGNTVEDGRWLTCGSADGALDLILRDIAVYFGPLARFEAASMFTNNRAQYSKRADPFQIALEKQDPVLRTIVSQMNGTMATPVALPDLARSAGISRRSMARLFDRELGMSPGNFYQFLRLHRARQLLQEPGMSLRDVALRCGYSRGSTLQRAHQTAFGSTIR